MKLAPIFHINSQSWSLGDLSNHLAKPLSLDQIEAHIKDFEETKRKLADAKARVKELEKWKSAAKSMWRGIMAEHSPDLLQEAIYEVGKLIDAESTLVDAMPRKEGV